MTELYECFVEIIQTTKQHFFEILMGPRCCSLILPFRITSEVIENCLPRVLSSIFNEILRPTFGVQSYNLYQTR